MVTLTLKGLLARLKGLLPVFPSGRRVISLLMGTKFDYASKVDPSKSSIVEAVVGWIVRTFPEAPVIVMRRDANGAEEAWWDHPMLELLERPNPYYSGPLLWMATINDYVTNGNAYWLKLRNSQGRPVQLWWIPQQLIDPKWPKDGSEYLTHYEYKPANTPIPYEPADIVHFRRGLDPDNTRKGLSPLASLMREVFTDEEAANFSASLLRNMGIPGVVISPDGDGVDLTLEDADQIKKDFNSKFTGDKRGEPMVMSAKVKAQLLSFNPQQMDLKTLRRIPEERVSAVFGVAAIVAGLGAGLDRSTFANMAEAREMAYESNIIPTQRLLAAELETQLLPDFGDIKGLDVVFDSSKVRVLQEDQNKLWTRMDMAVRGGWCKVSTAKAAVGLPVEKGDDVYLRSFSIAEVGPDAPPEPPAVADPPKRLAPPVTKGFSQDAKDKIGLLFYKRLDRRESRFKRAMKAFFQDWEEALLARLEAQKGMTKDAAGDLLDDEAEWARRLRGVGKPLVMATLQEAAEDAIGDYTLGINFDLQNPKVQRWIGERMRLFSTTIPRTTIEDITATLRDGEAAGEGIPQLMDRVKGYFDENADRRAEVIARTECVSASNQGAIEAYGQAGVEEWEWLTTADDRLCDECLLLDGAIAPVSQPFDPPHPQCRCAALPVMRG